ncbi:MAG: zinc-binding dehydrogenase [Deltaproteobacteria bacterium]|jgi:2-desacetyl-2-hydroxyethyl bacteriochlorophyllide A dehydrogenase|nr:zinc-binding dehydrogenase [Deltaproteobacteria bacterium]
MKALYFDEHGELDVIKYGDVPDPKAAGGEVLVRVRACALNYLDIWVRRGWPGLKLEMPHWCGADMAGEIVELGTGVSSWQVGQRVVVNPGVNAYEDEFTRKGEDSVSPGYHIMGEHVRGGAAEYIAVPAANLEAIPDSVDFPEAAAPLLVGLTAWRMLIHRAGLQAGETVLVVGAGGGVNSIAIQIAKLAGATVFTVASNPQKAQMAQELGADVVIDRSQADWGKEIFKLTSKRGVDVVVDNVGRATLNTSMLAVARGGRIVIVGNTSGPQTEIDIRYLFSKQISLIGSTMGSREDFKTVTGLLREGKIRPVIDSVMPLSEGQEAYRRMEEGRQSGKIILTP